MQVNLYRGRYLANGGSSIGGRFGGPGTLYLQDVRNKRPFTRLLIDNQMRLLSDVVTLDETNVTFYEFDEIHLMKRAALTMAAREQRMVLKMKKLIGDRTGLLHSQTNHVMHLEASDTAVSVSKPAVNLQIDKDSEMVFGSSLYIIGDGAKGQLVGNSSLTLNGRMTDTINLHITKRLKVRFLRYVHTADLQNVTLVVSEVGSFTLATLEIQDGAELIFPHADGINCDLGLMHMKYGAKIVADKYMVGVTSLQMETGSEMTASGHNRPAPNVGSSLPSGCRGAGGSHGSNGGKG